MQIDGLVSPTKGEKGGHGKEAEEEERRRMPSWMAQVQRGSRKRVWERESKNAQADEGVMTASQVNRQGRSAANNQVWQVPGNSVANQNRSTCLERAESLYAPTQREGAV